MSIKPLTNDANVDEMSDNMSVDELLRAEHELTAENDGDVGEATAADGVDDMVLDEVQRARNESLLVLEDDGLEDMDDDELAGELMVENAAGDDTPPGGNDMVVHEIQRAAAVLLLMAENDPRNVSAGELQSDVADGDGGTEDDPAADSNSDVVVVESESRDDEATASTASLGSDGDDVTIVQPEQPKKKRKGNSKIDYPGGSKDAYLDVLAGRVRGADDKVGTLTTVQNELYDLCRRSGVADKTAINLQNDLRNRVRDEFPKDENGRKHQLPRLPDALQPKMRERRPMAAQATTARNENPIRVNGDLLVQLAVEGVRDGIERGQVPQVLHCMAFLIALRANDLNPGHTRQGTDRRASAETHVFAETTKSGVVIEGTLLNRWPSKYNPNYEPPEPYGTVFICDQKDYELIQRALQFIFDNKDLPCTRTMKEYQDNVPSGPETTPENGAAECTSGSASS